MTDPWSARVLSSPLRISPDTYSPSQWALDLEVLWRVGRNHALTQQEIQTFVALKYPDLLELRTERLLAALNFQVENLPALVDADLAHCNEWGTSISWLIMVALYRWLIIRPWPGRFQPPPCDAIIELAKGPWLSQRDAHSE